MRSNAASCSTWQLYVIIDRAAARGRDLAHLAQQAIRGGADVIQLRDKTASTRDLIDEAQRMLRVTRPMGTPLVINDRADVALAVEADGVHVGQDDLPVSVARRIVGPSRLVGTSTHSLEQALRAQEEAIDYFAVGPIFPTPTKPDYASVGMRLIEQVASRAKKPWLAISGIDHDTVPSVIAAGVHCVAVVRAVCAADDPASAARILKQRLMQGGANPARFT